MIEHITSIKTHFEDLLIDNMKEAALAVNPEWLESLSEPKLKQLFADAMYCCPCFKTEHFEARFSGYDLRTYMLKVHIDHPTTHDYLGTLTMSSGAAFHKKMKKVVKKVYSDSLTKKNK